METQEETKPRYEQLTEREKLFWWVIGTLCFLTLFGTFFAVIILSKLPSVSG